jgi:hypothetical protein
MPRMLPIPRNPPILPILPIHPIRPIRPSHLIPRISPFLLIPRMFRHLLTLLIRWRQWIRRTQQRIPWVLEMLSATVSRWATGTAAVPGAAT